MGVLLSICFKSREESNQANSQVHVKKQKAKRQKSVSKQHLLDTGSPRGGQGYNSTAPASPRGVMERAPSWNKPPPPPGSPNMSEMHAPGAFMTPPPSPREPDDRKSGGGMGRTLSFRLNPTDTGQPKQKRSFRSKSAKR